MSPRRLKASIRAGRFPRVSGDEPPGGAIHYKTIMFSPRERG